MNHSTQTYQAQQQQQSTNSEKQYKFKQSTKKMQKEEHDMSNLLKHTLALLLLTSVYNDLNISVEEASQLTSHQSQIPPIQLQKIKASLLAMVLALVLITPLQNRLLNTVLLSVWLTFVLI